ncbi:MAG: leucine--tRNA ligase [Candidatus Altiarchaeota archaeon]
MSQDKSLEAKWLARWRRERVFESDPDSSKPKYYLTVPYPYASGALHVGHARSYTLGDVTARYKRMSGFNVLFPMASHITGTPILAISRKIEQGDEKALKGHKEYVSFYEPDTGKIDGIVSGFKDPENVAKFYANAIRQDFEDMGYAIDWRRFFTTGDRIYNAFVRWQYLKLKEKGYIGKGKHAVYFCTGCSNPVTTDDIKSGDEYEIGMSEYYLIKMKFEDGWIVAATLRPETVFGIVNTWINPDETYVKATVDGETWYVAERFGRKFGDQQHEVKVVKSMKGSELVGKKLTVPLVNRVVPLLAAEFVDADIATGVVNSVPAHAPYDYIAGLEAEKRLNIKLTPIPLISVDGYSAVPAKDLVEKGGITSQTEVDMLDKVTAELYKDEFYRGTMNDNCGDYAGMRVQEAKDQVIDRLRGMGQLSTMYDMAIKDRAGALVKNPQCRCGTSLTIKILSDQWFLNYGDRGWKELAKELLLKLDIEPQMYRRGFEHTIDWLHEWPCTRNRGLGTKLPFDEKWMIESLSDSTVYMAFYTISGRIKAGKIAESQLQPEFFDHVFLGAGEPGSVAKKCGIDAETLSQMRKEFLYWYPMDERRTATAHISNHLTFMMFHHAAIFESQHWPKKISLNEMLIAEGRKMSKSLGNVIPIHTSIGKYGADVVRLYLVYAADPETTLDWRESQAENTRKRLRQFQEMVEKAAAMPDAKQAENDVDKWLRNRMTERVCAARASLDDSNARKAIQSTLYDLLADINWYVRRQDKPNPGLMRELADKWIRLMSPFTPFTCEELWEKTGHKSLVTTEKYPAADEKTIDPIVDAKEEYIRNILSDTQNIFQVLKKPAKSIHLYVSSPWKYGVYSSIKEGKSMKDLMADPALRQYGKEIAKLAQMRKEQLPAVILDRPAEHKTLQDAQPFLSKELGIPATVYDEATYDPEQKSRHAAPMKPGIYAEC